MTIRDKLKSQMFKARCVGFGFWLLFAAGMFLPKNGGYQFLQFIPFAGFAGSILYILLMVKCPKCDARLGQSLNNLKNTNFCPACGVSFDKQA